MEDPAAKLFQLLRGVPVRPKVGSLPVDSDEMRPEHMNSLIALVANHGDKAAFEVIYRHFVPKLRSFMARTSHEPAVVDEYVQEAMVSVWRKASQFDPARGRLSTWIFAIARNVRIDALRRGPKPDFDASDPLLAMHEVEPADLVVLRTQEAEALNKAMNELKPDHIEVLRMSYFEGMAHGAIAEKLGLPLGTVKSRIRLACEKLRDSLGDL